MLIKHFVVHHTHQYRKILREIDLKQKEYIHTHSQSNHFIIQAFEKGPRKWP